MDVLIESSHGQDAVSFHLRRWAGDAWEPMTGSPYEVDDPFRQVTTLPNGSFAVITTTLVAVIDPATGSHIEVSLPDESGLGVFPTAIGLPDGRLVLLGGVDPEQWDDFTDATTEWMDAVREVPEGVPTPAFPLPDAETTDGALVIDPTTGRVDQYRLPSARAMVAASLLPDGRVLLVGGVPVFAQGGFLPGPTWVFDPDTGVFEELPALEVSPSTGSTVTLADGRVLILGLFAESATSARTRAYLYQP
jgi:hypothetical protein